MKYTSFSDKITKRELLDFCKGKVPGYSRSAKEGKTALLEFVNAWIAAENGKESALPAEPQVLAGCGDSEPLALAQESQEQVVLMSAPEASTEPLNEPAAKSCDRTVATGVAYTFAGIAILALTLLLWLLEAMHIAFKGIQVSNRCARQLWADLRLQWGYLEWPWQPVLQIAAAFVE